MKILKYPAWRRILMMLAGIVVIGLGAALIKLSGMGNDPYTAMALYFLLAATEHCEEIYRKQRFPRQEYPLRLYCRLYDFLNTYRKGEAAVD